MGKKINPVSYSHSPLIKKDPHLWRSVFMLGFVFTLLLAVLSRAAYLQMYKKDFLQDKGEARYARNITIPALRGKIFDRNGEILAMSSPVKSVWAIPEDAEDMTKEELNKLAKLLNMKSTEIQAKIEKGKNFVYLKRQVEPEVFKEIQAAKFPGVHLENTFKRYYPTGEMTSHITGFTDIEETGQEGIELAFNKVLQGVDGERKVLKNRRGQVIEEVGAMIEPQNGKDVYLTIDNKLQFIATNVLEETVAKHKAKAGSVVVLDAKTGEILALVNYPNYNPNNREGLNGEKLRNRALTDLFEPGSTMKPFSVGMGLDRKLVRPDTVFDTSSVVIGNKSISDAHGHPSLTVAQIIQKSSNIGTVKIAMKLKPEELWGLFNDVGFGKQVGVGFPGEAKGVMRAAKTWKPIEQATMSFGHGISVSLMQMAHAYLAFTNNGNVLPVSLIKKNKEDAIVEGKRVFSEETAKQMQIMMEAVTNTGGTATEAQTPSYRTAGKTGTAMKLDHGHYVNKYVGSFIGFAPVSEPKIIVAVMIDEPRANGYYGGLTAAPAFSKITEASLRSLGVKPDIVRDTLLPSELAKQAELAKQNAEMEVIPTVPGEESMLPQEETVPVKQNVNKSQAVATTTKEVSQQNQNIEPKEKKVKKEEPLPIAQVPTKTNNSKPQVVSSVASQPSKETSKESKPIEPKNNKVKKEEPDPVMDLLKSKNIL